MSDDNDSDIAAKFMLAEYQDLYQNVMHVENSLFSHLSFYTTLFMGIVTASIAILQLTRGSGAPLAVRSVLGWLALLLFLFLVVGRFELRMTTELRIRKMKFVEGITETRQYFLKKDEAIGKHLVLPVGIQKAPPYLRVRSADWYQVIYISLLNGLSAAMFWFLLGAWIHQLLVSQLGGTVVVLLAIIWSGLGIVLFYFVFWVMSYQSTVEFCASYDRKREEMMQEKSKYDLFERPLPKSRLQWTFGDWIRWIEEKRETGTGHGSN